LVRVHGRMGLRECGSRKYPSTPPTGNSFALKSNQISFASHSRVLLRSLNKQLPNQIKRQQPPDGASLATELANQSSFDGGADCPTQQKSNGCHLCNSGCRVMPFVSMELVVTMTAEQTAHGPFDSPILDSSDGTGRQTVRGQIALGHRLPVNARESCAKGEPDAIPGEGDEESVRESTGARTAPSFPVVWSKRSDGGD
jgi:hypothetical protein